MSFPKCVDILLASYGKLLWNDVQKLELADTVRRYRKTGDCEKVMEEISLKLNYLAKYKVPDFDDTCPPAFLNMIMSPSKTLDWTRAAVWLIYSELYLEDLPFTQDILAKMESKLLRDSRHVARIPNPRSPSPFAGGAREAMTDMLMKLKNIR